MAASAALTGWVAARHGLRPAPFLLGAVWAALGALLTIAFVRETRHLVSLERHGAASDEAYPRFWDTTLRDRDLSSVTQAGFVNNLNDGMAWGLFPGLFAAAGLGLAQTGVLVAIYPAVWGVAQLGTGAVSDRIGRKGMIAAGMFVQALALGVVARGGGVPAFAAGQVLLGVGARGDRGRGSSRATGVRGGDVPPVAGPRVCRRGAARGGARGRARRGGRRGRGGDAHRGLRGPRRRSDAGDAPGSTRGVGPADRRISASRRPSRAPHRGRRPAAPCSRPSTSGTWPRRGWTHGPGRRP